MYRPLICRNMKIYWSVKLKVLPYFPTIVHAYLYRMIEMISHKICYSIVSHVLELLILTSFVCQYLYKCDLFFLCSPPETQKKMAMRYYIYMFTHFYIRVLMESWLMNLLHYSLQSMCWSLSRFISASRLIGRRMEHRWPWCLMKLASETSREYITTHWHMINLHSL